MGNLLGAGAGTFGVSRKCLNPALERLYTSQVAEGKTSPQSDKVELIPPRLSVVYLPEARSRASNNEEKTNVTKNKLSKLTLRRETLTVLEMKAATGGVTVSGNTIVVAQTVHSVCALCIPIPVIPPREWPQTGG
jgi:hypothetical protein